MKIQIHTDDVHLTLQIPTYLAFNALTASIAGHELKKHDFPQLDGKSLTVLFRELRRLKKKHPAWRLLHLEAAKDMQIEIML